MQRTEQPLSVVLLDCVDIEVAEVSDATSTTHHPGMTTVTIHLVPFAYIRKKWEVTLKVHSYIFNFVYSSIYGELPLQTAYTQS